jgi:hypothetical protein
MTAQNPMNAQARMPGSSFAAPFAAKAVAVVAMVAIKVLIAVLMISSPLGFCFRLDDFIRAASVPVSEKIV